MTQLAIMRLPFDLHLACGRDNFVKLCRRLKLNVPEPADARFQAMVYEYLHRGHVIVNLVDYEECTGIEIACVLVHEAVHVWQLAMEQIGEHKHGCEAEAYAIQRISQHLMEQFHAHEYKRVG